MRIVLGFVSRWNPFVVAESKIAWTNAMIAAPDKLGLEID